jgi:hypothetical protein
MTSLFCGKYRKGTPFSFHFPPFCFLFHFETFRETLFPQYPPKALKKPFFTLWHDSCIVFGRTKAAQAAKHFNKEVHPL